MPEIDNEVEQLLEKMVDECVGENTPDAYLARIAPRMLRVVLREIQNGGVVACKFHTIDEYGKEYPILKHQFHRFLEGKE